MRPMRWASSRIIRTMSRCSSSMSSRSRVSANPEMIAAGLLISWATPLTSWPIAASFSLTSRTRARTLRIFPPSRTGA